MPKLKDIFGDKWPERKEVIGWPPQLGDPENSVNEGYNECLDELGELEINQCNCKNEFGQSVKKIGGGFYKCPVCGGLILLKPSNNLTA